MGPARCSEFDNAVAAVGPVPLSGSCTLCRSVRVAAVVAVRVVLTVSSCRSVLVFALLAVRRALANSSFSRSGYAAAPADFHAVSGALCLRMDESHSSAGTAHCFPRMGWVCSEVP